MTKDSFTVPAGPDTDIWKIPPHTDRFEAPFEKLDSGPLLKFSSATLTFSSTYVQQYDQGGLLLTLTSPSGQRKWIKAGVECLDDSARLSVVACDTWADWSVVTPPEGADEIKRGTKKVTIRVEAHECPIGRSLWVYYVDGEKKVPLREICWVYGYGDDWTLEVTGAAARPGKEIDGELKVHFDSFEVKWDQKWEI